MKLPPKQDAINLIAASALFTLTLIFFTPLNIFYTNISEFNFTGKELLLFLGIITIIVTSLITYISLLFKPSVYKKITVILCILGFLLWLEANILPWKFGAFNGAKIDWASQNIYGYIDNTIWLTAIIMAALSFNVAYKIVKLISLILITTQIIFLGVTINNTTEITSSKNYSIDESNKFTFSKEKNVIIIVLDTFQTDMFQEIIDEDPSLKDAFDGFTYFKNTTSHFTYTETSVSSMLTSQMYNNSIPFEEYKKNAYLSENSILKKLKDKGFETDVFPFEENALFFDPNIESNVTLKQWNLIPINKKFTKATLFKETPFFTKRFFEPQQVNSMYLVPFNNNSASKSTIIEKPIFKFYHLQGPHLPIWVDGKPAEPTRENYKKQAKAYLSGVKDLLENLKSLYIYDNSSIFLMGDHGAGMQGQHFILPKSWQTSDNRSSISTNFQSTALPLLIAKKSGSRGQLVISDLPVELSDIPETIFQELNIKETKSPNNISIFTGAPISPLRKRKMFFYNEKTNGVYSNMSEYIISGPAWLNTSWTKTGIIYTPKEPIIPPLKKYEFPLTINFGQTGNSNQFKNMGWGYTEDTWTWTEGKDSSLVIPIKTTPKSNLTLEMEIYPFLAQGKIENQAINLYVNNNLLWDNIKINKQGKYKIIIPKEIIKDDEIRIDFNIPEAASPKSLGLSEDERILGLSLKTLKISK